MQQTPKSYRQVLLEGGSRVAESPDRSSLESLPRPADWSSLDRSANSYSPSEFSSAASTPMQTSSSVQLLPKRKSDKPGNDGTKKRRKRAKRRVWEVSLVDGTEAESASVLESYKYKEGYLHEKGAKQGVYR